MGEHTTAVVKYFLTNGKNPEQDYKFCASITKLADRYGAERVEIACGQMLSIASIRTLSTILKNDTTARCPIKWTIRK